MGGRREVQDGGAICIPVADCILMYGRNQHNIVKQLASNKFFFFFKLWMGRLTFCKRVNYEEGVEMSIRIG